MNPSQSNFLTSTFIHIVTLLLCFWFLNTEASGAITARYLMIELPGEKRILSLAEVEVYSQKKLISVNGKATQSSTFSSADASRAIDGNASGDYFKGSVTHTLPGQWAWWRLDLGADRKVTKIVVFNRTDCCGARINPARLILLDGRNEIVWQENIITNATKFEFQITKQSNYRPFVSANILRNADFRFSTNPPIPDYWDLHHAASLRLQNVYSQYFLDGQTKPPINGVNVLSIQNSVDNFSHLILMPRRFYAPLVAGNYVFSLYVKSDVNNAKITVTPGWAKGNTFSKKITTQWERYVFVFNRVDTKSSDLQPIIYFPSKAKYFIAAPQLEYGTHPSEFHAAYGDTQAINPPNEKNNTSLAFPLEEMAVVNGTRKIPPLSMAFEFAYYTNDSRAHLSITSNMADKITANLICKALTGEEVVFQKRGIEVNPKSQSGIDLQINAIPKGDYVCSLHSKGAGQISISSATRLTILPSNSVEVRTDKHKRMLEINHRPFYMIGISVIAGDPPEWYLRDLAKHHFNTIFYNAEVNNRGEYKISNVEKVVTNAAQHGLNVIIGLSMAGEKPANWRERFTKFIRLIVRLKNHANIIGWYPVDEPAANSWRDEELEEIYRRIKSVDPYRLVFVNWAYDGIPKKAGQQPRGTLTASDFYSLDYYPFAGLGRDLAGFTTTTIKVAETAAMYDKVCHSWLQLFGGMTAWREPTGEELNYMAFLNYIYRGMISYFDTKSNSYGTWRQIATINKQGLELAEKLFLNDQAEEIVPPTITQSFIYSVWSKGNRYLLLVLNGNKQQAVFDYKLTLLPKNVSGYHATSLFETRSVSILNNRIHEQFNGLQSRVYEIKSQ